MNTECPGIVVCVPAKNEAAQLPRLLSALAFQSVPATVVIALNNSTDQSLTAIKSACHKYKNLRVVVDEATFPPEQAHAGSARRRAMDLGAVLVRKSGILITTDADARPPADWIAANVLAIRSGLDIVGGRICIDDSEDIAPGIKDMVEMTDRYWAQVRMIEDDLDLIPWDPPPRHGDHTGASLAMTVQRYVLSGGVPLIATEEDRALVRAICIRGGKLGHPLSVWTRVSARTVGRAQTGMAEAMARLLLASGAGTPIMLPHYRHWEERARWRRAIRDRFGSAKVVALEQALQPLPCDMPLYPARGR